MSAAYAERILETTLHTWAAAQSPAFSVAWQNVPFTPQDNTRWAQAFVLPADTLSETLDKVHRGYHGVFQVTLNIPAGQGLGSVRGLVDSLDAAFTTTAPLALVIASVTVMRLFITRPMSRGPAQNLPGFASVPVSCSYRGDVV